MHCSFIRMKRTGEECGNNNIRRHLHPPFKNPGFATALLNLAANSTGIQRASFILGWRTEERRPDGRTHVITRYRLSVHSTTPSSCMYILIVGPITSSQRSVFENWFENGRHLFCQCRTFYAIQWWMQAAYKSSQGGNSGGGRIWTLHHTI